MFVIEAAVAPAHARQRGRLGPHRGAGLDGVDDEAARGELGGEDPGAGAEVGDAIAGVHAGAGQEPIDQCVGITGAGRVGLGLGSEVAECHSGRMPR